MTTLMNKFQSFRMFAAATEGTEGGVNEAMISGNPLALGQQVPADVDDLMADLVIKQEDVKLGPVDLYFLMDRHNMLDLFPRVGSSYSDEKKTNHPAGPETFKDGKGQEHNFFTDYFRSTPHGMRWWRRVEDIKRSLANEANLETLISEDNADVLERHGDTRWMKEQKELYESRLQNGRNMLRKSVQMRDTFDKMEAFKDIIGFQFNTVTEKDGVIRPARTKKPVTMIDVASKDVLKPNSPLTLGDFLKLSKAETIDKAQKNGATYQGFVSALERENNRNRTDTTAVIIKNLKQAFPVVRAAATFFDDSTAEGKKHLTGLLKELANPENDELVEAIGDLFYSLDGTIMEAIGGRYEKLKKQRNASLGSDLQPNTQKPQQLAS